MLALLLAHRAKSACVPLLRTEVAAPLRASSNRVTLHAAHPAHLAALVGAGLHARVESAILAEQGELGVAIAAHGQKRVQDVRASGLWPLAITRCGRSTGCRFARILYRSVLGHRHRRALEGKSADVSSAPVTRGHHRERVGGGVALRLLDGKALVHARDVVAECIWTGHPLQGGQVQVICSIYGSQGIIVAIVPRDRAASNIVAVILHGVERGKAIQVLLACFAVEATRGHPVLRASGCVPCVHPKPHDGCVGNNAFVEHFEYALQLLVGLRPLLDHVALRDDRFQQSLLRKPNSHLRTEPAVEGGGHDVLLRLAGGAKRSKKLARLYVEQEELRLRSDARRHPF
mmetsp:Transcript_31426/g.86413  ORF Transcript_31426/g.86413 Transcript_31426/m.86413 type:complete len:346 (-) Transcript_31426:381-1418(-)